MNFLMLVLTASLSYAALAENLAGTWINADAPAGRPISFVKVNGAFHHHSRESFVFDSGALSHTIDQTVTLSGHASLAGSADFFDSRGCVFKDLPVVAEFESEDVVNVLMTVPRYKFVVTTVTREDQDRPRWCRIPYPGYGHYVCGREREIVSRRGECELLEHVSVPVRLLRRRW
jgi:hypothetical protein